MCAFPVTSCILVWSPLTNSTAHSCRQRRDLTSGLELEALICIEQDSPLLPVGSCLSFLTAGPPPRAGDRSGPKGSTMLGGLILVQHSLFFLASQPKPGCRELRGMISTPVSHPNKCLRRPALPAACWKEPSLISWPWNDGVRASSGLALIE